MRPQNDAAFGYLYIIFFRFRDFQKILMRPKIISFFIFVCILCELFPSWMEKQAKQTHRLIIRCHRDLSVGLI